MNEFKAGYNQALNEIANEINGIISGLRTYCNPDPLGTTEECLADAEIQALELVLDTIKEKAKY